MENNLAEYFPELKGQNIETSNGISNDELENHPYFIDLVRNIVEAYDENNQETESRNFKSKKLKIKQQDIQIKQFQDTGMLINKCLSKMKVLILKKGTVIYTPGMLSEDGYIVIHGCIELLLKKNSRQKLETYPGHICHTPQERIQFLKDHFHISPDKAEKLQEIFFEEQILFNFLTFRSIYGQGYFGFGELMRGSLRTKMAITTQQTILLKINKSNFEKYFRDFEERREKYIIDCMLLNMKEQIKEEMQQKMKLMFNSAELIRYEKGEMILKENDGVNGIFFLLDGECTISKSVVMEVPKKYLTSENKGELIKEADLKLSKAIKNSYIGDIQLLLSFKKRQYTVQAITNNTILIKFETIAFFKTIAESTLFEREISLNAKYKHHSLTNHYHQQTNKIIAKFQEQFQLMDQKRKQKQINKMMSEDNFKKKQLYEVFNKEGMFYRDSFEKLEGFDQFAQKYDPKRSMIPKHKVKSTHQLESEKKAKRKHKLGVKEKDQMDMEMETNEKLLLSPKRQANALELLTDGFVTKMTALSEHTSQSNLRKKSKKLFSKFQQLKKDDTIYKRVLIKNGLFQKDKETNKSNIMKAIVNHHFDSVIKECMVRKNQFLRKAVVQNKNSILEENFYKTVSSLKKTSFSHRFSSISYTCKGTDQLKKKLQKFKIYKRLETKSNEKKLEEQQLQNFIGINRAPSTSELKGRPTLIKSKVKCPEKVVLLNHMMKPITYYSQQL